MGHGNHMFDYLKASDLLLKRSYPEIADGTQEGPIFIPEAFIPEKYTRGVDPDNFEEKLRQYHSSKYPKEKKVTVVLRRTSAPYTSQYHLSTI